MHSILSVSSPLFDDKCNNVIYVIRNLGLCADVTCNKTITPKGQLENGCKILTDDIKSSKVLWNKLKDEFHLTCGHVSVEHSKNGCVWDVFSDSKCPQK